MLSLTVYPAPNAVSDLTSLFMYTPPKNANISNNIARYIINLASFITFIFTCLFIFYLLLQLLLLVLPPLQHLNRLAQFFLQRQLRFLLILPLHDFADIWQSNPTSFFFCGIRLSQNGGAGHEGVHFGQMSGIEVGKRVFVGNR